jgi:hypothetical protein
VGASVGLEKNARAQDFQEIHVCGRPPNVPANVERWAYSPGGTVFTASQGKFREKSRGLTIYVFDPGASVKSPVLLPKPYNTLTCAPSAAALAPGPQSPPEEAGEKEKKEKKDDKKGEAPGTADKKPANADKDKDEPPPGTPPPIVYPKKDPEPERQHLPAEGVTTKWPTSVLPMRHHEDGDEQKGPRTVLPIMTVLPLAHHGQPGSGGAGTQGSGDGKNGGGPPKTAFDKVAEQLAFAGAIANQQLNEDTKRADGKRYGIPGGTNKDGPNSAAAQAAAGATLVVAGVLSAAGFEKKLKAAFAKKAPIPMEDMAKLGKETVEDLIKAKVEEQAAKGAAREAAAKKAAENARTGIAMMLHQTQTIGPYEAMQQCTAGLKGGYQAHHILEKNVAEKLGLGNADKVPSIILTEAEHKQVTKELGTKTRDLVDLVAENKITKADALSKIWTIYQEAYKKQPAWLAAIKPYFVQGK